MIHPLLRGVATRRDGRPELELGRRDFYFRDRFTYLHPRSSLLIFFCFFLSYFILAVFANTGVFGKTHFLPIAILNSTSFFRETK